MPGVNTTLAVGPLLRPLESEITLRTSEPHTWQLAALATQVE
jgi:hypothetical protein